jgi:murein DD-endopeptidase MepM/ murein hydrolase activator NlpD
VPGEAFLVPAVQDDTFRWLPVPLLEVQVRPTRAIQGRTLQVDVLSLSPIQLLGSVGEEDLNFLAREGGHYTALQGIPALAELGLYDLVLRYERPDQVGAVVEIRQPLRIASGGYSFDPVLYVPEETVDPANTGPEDELIASIVAQVTGEIRWEGSFDYPSLNITAFPSYFGSRRNYNDLGYQFYHTGLDFYGGVGTPITAPANGRVVFAGPLEVRGLVTFLDHGWGVYSGFLHQSELNVEVGQNIERGQTIGWVGRSGRVTGPHLHWEVWVGGVPVDPMEWVSQVFPYSSESSAPE